MCGSSALEWECRRHGDEAMSRSRIGPAAGLALASLVLAGCAKALRWRQEIAFQPYQLPDSRPTFPPDLDPEIRVWVGRAVWVGPEGTGIDSLRSCYRVGIPYLRNAYRQNLDLYRITRFEQSSA